MVSYSFRDVGPRVFISYSFKDKEAATHVASFLTASGCRVQMEDEVSLIGRRLPEVLPERIGDAEAFIQVCTAFASRSYWVAKELEYASVRREGAAQLAVVPLVLDGEAFLGPAYSAGSVDASSGLSDQVLQKLKERVFESVHPLPLRDTDPFRFDSGALDRALRAAPADHRRIIVDSDGKLLRWMDETLSYIEKSDVPHRDKWLKQERHRKTRLIEFLKDLDRQATRLINCLAEAYSAWKCQFPGSAARALDYFSLVRVGLAVVERAAQAPPAHEDLRSKVVGRFASLVAQLPEEREVYQAYLKWIAGENYLRLGPSLEDRAASNALKRAGIDDKAFAYFVQEAKRNLSIALRTKNVP